MPLYRIYRMKEGPREHFRWAPHTGGEALIKWKDYEVGATMESANPYAAWKRLAEENTPLRTGDLLELLGSEPATEEVLPNLTTELLIAKYIGFEPAKWFVPQPKQPEARTDLPSISAEAPAPTSP